MRLERIWIYPIKSLDPQELDSVPVNRSGTLKYDRQWALMNAQGEFVNGKRSPAIQRLSSEVDLRHRMLTIGPRGESSLIFHLDRQREELQEWLSAYFDEPIRVVENTSFGYPDDTESPGPTVVSTATLETVAGWFPEMSVEEVRRRFRANLEIGGVEPFWEDRLYGPERETVRFEIGPVTFEGTNPCQRCAVPPRDSRKGENHPPGFAKMFGEKRKETLPPWAAADRFDHFYRLTTNTRLLAGEEQVLSLGDSVRLI